MEHKLEHAFLKSFKVVVFLMIHYDPVLIRLWDGS